MCRTFIVDFNWASQAIIEMVMEAFPSLEAPVGQVVAEPGAPALEHGAMSHRVTSTLGNGRWQRDSSYRFNAGCNREVNTAPPNDEVGLVASPQELNQLKLWFQQRYPNSRPTILSNASKVNFTLVHRHCVFNFHLRSGS